MRAREKLRKADEPMGRQLPLPGNIPASFNSEVAIIVVVIVVLCASIDRGGTTSRPL